MDTIPKRLTLALFRETHAGEVVFGAHCLELNVGGCGSSEQESVRDAVDAVHTVQDLVAAGQPWAPSQPAAGEPSALEELQEHADGPVRIVPFPESA